MKLIVCTTQTKHHIYFVNKIYEKLSIDSVFYERRRLSKKYITGPFYDDEQDKYEELFFDKDRGGVEKTYPKELDKRVITGYSINQPGMDAYIKALEPDIIIVFGTGRIHPHLLNIPRWGMINLHGGITQRYRRLDSTLWALFNKDFENLGITIHYVEPELDAGDILSQKKSQLKRPMRYTISDIR